MKILRVSQKARYITAIVSFLSIFSGIISLFYRITSQKMQLTWQFWKSALFYSLLLFAVGVFILIFFRVCEYKKAKARQDLRSFGQTTKLARDS